MDPSLLPISGADIRFEPRAWPFAEAHVAEIEAHWRRRRAEQPRLYNGGVLLLGPWSLAGGAIAGECFATDFRSFLYWRENDAPDRSVADLFAAAAFHSREGWLIVGRMGAHTANRGRIYPPCGSLHQDDVRDGRIDLDGSILRELAEETGFRLAVRDFEPPVLVRDGARLVYMRPIRFPQPAAEIVACIERFLQGQDEPELAEILVVKGPEDIASSMPGFAAAYIRHAFA